MIQGFSPIFGKRGKFIIIVSLLTTFVAINTFEGANVVAEKLTQA
jgi:hypothetical protein